MQTIEQIGVRPTAGVIGSFKPERPHIVAILPRGEAIRNFVHTGALDDISRVANLSLLSVIPNDEFAGMLNARFENVFELESIPERRIVNTVREMLDMAHGRWLWSEAAQERWRLRDREATTASLRFKRLVKKLTSLPFANRFGLDLLSSLERRSSRQFRSTDYYTRLFKEMKPSLVFNCSHVHAGVAVQAVQAAQWLGIPTAAFIFSWDNLTSQGRIVPSYDYYLVWNSAIREQLLQQYPSVRSHQVLVTGTPQFDFHFRPEFRWSREEFCRHVGADPLRPIVLYSTGMANHMPGEPEIVERIASLLTEMPEFGPPQLMVRVYPKDRTGRFEYLKRKCPDILFPEAPWEAAFLTPKIEDSYLLTNTLQHSAVGINVASTISLELCMFDVPVINVGYNPPGTAVDEVDYARYYSFDHYRQLVASGAVEVATSEDDLRRRLIAALLHPERRRNERKALLKRFFDTSLDGRSSSRLACVLDMLASGSNSPATREPLV